MVRLRSISILRMRRMLMIISSSVELKSSLTGGGLQNDSYQMESLQGLVYGMKLINL